MIWRPLSHVLDGKVAHWRLDIRDGNVEVSQSDDAADCMIGASAKLFDDLASGKANAMAAALRNELTQRPSRPWDQPRVV